MTNPPDWKQDQAETSRLPRKGKESAQTMLELDAERVALCERLIKYSDDVSCIAVNRNLAKDLIEAEAALTLLADENSALRTASAPGAVLEALRKLAIVQRHMMAYGGTTNHVGYACKVCDCGWDRDQPEQHKPNCAALATPDDASRNVPGNENGKMLHEHGHNFSEIREQNETTVLATPEEASEPEEISGEEMDLIERNALALIRPEEASTAPKWANRPANSFPQMQEASTAAGEAVAPSREVVEKALCCPKGCVREDDCFVSAPGAAVRYTRTSREHEQADAIMALYAAPPAAAGEAHDLEVMRIARAIAEHGFGRSWDDFLPVNAHDTDQGDLIEYSRAAVNAILAAPPAAQTDGVREATIEECAKACERRVYGKDGVPGGNEYGHYAPYNAEALACAKDVRRLALTRPNGNTP